MLIAKGQNVRLLLDGKPLHGELLDDHVPGEGHLCHTRILLDNGKVVDAASCLWIPSSANEPLTIEPDNGILMTSTKGNYENRSARH